MKRILYLIIFSTVVLISTAQPVNDDPAAAVTIPITSTYFASPISGTTIGATRTNLPANSINRYDDVWYKFEVSGAANSNVSIALTNIVFSSNITNYININLWNGSLTTVYAGSFNGLYNQLSLGIGTWYLQVWTDGNTSAERSNFDIGIKAINSATPINDDCASAITLTSSANTNCISATLGDNLGATSSTPALNNVKAKNDVWYKFIANSTKHIISLNNINWAPGIGYPIIFGPDTANVNIELGQGVCGTYTSLANSGIETYLITPTLIIGNEYFIRVSNILAKANIRFFDFNICVTSAPANDNVANATTIIPAIGNCYSIGSSITASTIGATPSPQATCASGTDNRDVWYNFTASSNYLRVGLDLPISSQTPNIELWNTGATTRIKCENSTNLESIVTNGTNYKLRIIGYTGTYINSFTLKLLCTVAPQANDDCSFDTTLPQNINIALPALASQSTAGASQFNFSTFAASCAGSNTGGDLWYSFIALKNSLNIELRNVVTTGSTNMSMQVYNAGCNATTPIAFACGNTVTANTLPGNFYALRIMKSDGCETATFNLHTELPPAPINDECVNAINVPVTTATTCTANILKLNATTLDATESVDALGVGCGFGNNDDVWFTFTTPAGNNKTLISITEIIANAITSGAGINYILYTGANCGVKAFVECGMISSFGDISSVSTMPNTKYYLRIYSSDFATQFSFKIGIISIAVANNFSCATATTVTATSDMSASTTFGNTLDVPSDESDCYGGTTGSRGVWYSFVATATTHFLNIGCVFSLGNGNVSTHAKVYSGACGALTELFCFNNISTEGGTVTGLIIGQTYKILILDFTPNSEPIAFAISVVGGLPLNDESVTAITLIQDAICLPSLGSTNFATNSVAPALAAHPLGYTYIGDTWYKFIASTSTVNLTITENSSDFLIKVYNNALTSLMPFDAGLTGAISSGGEHLELSGLTVGQNYYIRVVLSAQPPGMAPLNGIVRNFNICVWGLPSINIANIIGPGCRTASGPVTSTNSNRWLHITDAGRVLASVFDNSGGAGMGLINGYYFLNTGPVRGVSSASGAFLKYMDRNFEVTPFSQPINPVKVKLYFTKAELDALIASSLLTSHPILSVADLKICKLSSATCNTILTAADISNYYTILSFGEINSTFSYIEFEVPSFSSFFLGPQNFEILPLRFENLTAVLKGNSVNIDWEVSNIKNVNYFEIEKSLNGIVFEKIGSIASNSQQLKYQFKDLFIQKTTYYKIKTFFADGKYQYSKVVLIKPSDNLSEFQIYPNPVNEHNIQVSFNVSKAQNISIKIANSIGKIVIQKQTNVEQGNQNQLINIESLIKGNYYLSVFIDGRWISKNFTKIN